MSGWGNGDTLDLSALRNVDSISDLAYGGTTSTPYSMMHNYSFGKVNWVHKIDVQNTMLNEIEDYLFSIKGRYDLRFSIEELDKVMQLLLNVAKRREGYGG